MQPRLFEVLGGVREVLSAAFEVQRRMAGRVLFECRPAGTIPPGVGIELVMLVVRTLVAVSVVVLVLVCRVGGLGLAGALQSDLSQFALAHFQLAMLFLSHLPLAERLRGMLFGDAAGFLLGGEGFFSPRPLVLGPLALHLGGAQSCFGPLALDLRFFAGLVSHRPLLVSKLAGGFRVPYSGLRAIPFGLGDQPRLTLRELRGVPLSRRLLSRLSGGVCGPLRRGVLRERGSRPSRRQCNQEQSRGE